MRSNSVRLGKTKRAAVQFSCGFFFSFLAIHISNKGGDLIRRRRAKDCSGATKNRSLGWRDPIPRPASKAEKTRGPVQATAGSATPSPPLVPTSLADGSSPEWHRAAAVCYRRLVNHFPTVEGASQTIFEAHIDRY